jgi:hypothetical protein
VTEVKGFLRLDTLIREDLGFCVFDNTVDWSFSSEGQRFDHLGGRLRRKIRRCCLRRNVFNTGGGTWDLANFLLAAIPAPLIIRDFAIHRPVSLRSSTLKK